MLATDAVLANLRGSQDQTISDELVAPPRGRRAGSRIAERLTKLKAKMMPGGSEGSAAMEFGA